MSAWEWPGTVITRIVDADTVDATVTRDLGFGGTASFPVRLRLNRINAPKARSKPGRAAARAAAAYLDGAGPLHVVTVKPYKYGGPAGKVGEWMAEVTLPDGANLSDTLVAAGHAVYWDGQGPRPADG